MDSVATPGGRFTRRKALATAAGGIIASGTAAANGSNPTVTVAGGRLRGLSIEGIHRFLGVRYGENTASRRFRPAHPPGPWSGTREALAYPNQAPQPDLAFSPVYAGMMNSQPQSEDCLFLNIWTPEASAQKKRPVLVWLHGGGFVYGSGNTFPSDGGRLAKRGDVVVVAINHRLNVFGHLQLAEFLGKDFTDSGNVGILDIVLALQWVRDNIAAFGGDPGNVTIFGESGGGAKVHTLLAMPAAQGLFHKASIQSGGGGLAITTQESARYTEMFLKALDISTKDASRLLKLPISDIVDVYNKTFALIRYPGSRPVIDGTNLRQHPFYPNAPALSAHVPLMVGTTRTEATGILGGFFPDLFEIGWDSLEMRLGPIMTGWGIYDNVPLVATDPRKVAIVARTNMPQASPRDVFFAAASQSMFIRGAIRTAELKAQQGGANAYLWSLEWNTPIDGGKWGSPHGLDVPLVFDNIDKAEPIVGPHTPEAQSVADQMSNALIAFAYRGDPNNPSIPHWPSYDLKMRSTLMFDARSHLDHDPRGWLRELFALSA